MTSVAVIGDGVVGISTALAIQKSLDSARITIISADDFERSCSFGPAGLFRIDNNNWQNNRDYGRVTFDWYANMCKMVPGSVSGVKLLSGHIQSDSRETLQTQELANKDIVYNFRWLSEDEIQKQFHEPSKYCIHFSAYAAEGNKYVPYLRSQLKNVVFEKRSVTSLDELGNEFDVVVNCAGLQGGQLAGDDAHNMVPIRGIVVTVKAPWYKHFLYRDFDTFTIPKEDVVAIGSVKQSGNWNLEASEAEVQDILARYYKLQPAMKDAEVVSVWCNLRPSRTGGIRLEKHIRRTETGKQYTVVHNYGHGGAGFTLGWGTAVEAAKLVNEEFTKSRL